MCRIIFTTAILLNWICMTVFSQALQHPRDFLGHEVGADFKLARLEKIYTYFRQAAEASPRVMVENKGESTEGNPYLMATVSAPENLENIETYKTYQRLLSHPNELTGNRDEVLQQSKCVVLIACSLHSNEIAASQMAMELLYELATRDDDEVNEILENTIILLVPAANPDGIDKIIDWYEKSLRTPWEGQGMPWLYQKYTGHDNNRDWFMISQKETQILTKILYHEWYPCILYDIHQMGNAGLRFFVPPFYDPINPNMDPLINESQKIIGGHMATRFSRKGKTGIADRAVYDNWWNGGNRNTPYRHNIIGLLTEAASPRIASPVFQRKASLRGTSRGLPEYSQHVNFSEPWEGGWWRLRDVVEYELTATYALLQVAARYRDQFNENYMHMGEKAIKAGKEIPPYAFLIPPDQRDMPTALRLLNTLHLGGVEISQAENDFTADGISYPEGTYIIFSTQPYRHYIRDLLEPQEYPDRLQYPGGPPEPPYDVSGWTLSYQMGVNVIPVQRNIEVNAKTLDTVPHPQGTITGTGENYISANHTTNDFILLNRAWQEGVEVHVLSDSWQGYAAGSLVFKPEDDQQRTRFENWIEELGIDMQQTVSNIQDEVQSKLPKPRLGLYHPWDASMDEGWTRFVLEQFEYDYQSVYNADIRAGNLRDRYDVIVIPDVSSHTILQGMEESTTAPQYAGGINDLGVMHLQEFVEAGGRLVCLDSSCLFAIRYFNLPVQNVLQDVNQRQFFCPGSILRVNINQESSLAYGAPKRIGAYFARSYAFDKAEANQRPDTLPSVSVKSPVATYDDTVTLLSGWITGEEHIQNKAAIMHVEYGEGDIVLFGFRVQHRAQTHGTFRFLFNAIANY